MVCPLSIFLFLVYHANCASQMVLQRMQRQYATESEREVNSYCTECIDIDHIHHAFDLIVYTLTLYVLYFEQ